MKIGQVGRIYGKLILLQGLRLLLGYCVIIRSKFMYFFMPRTLVLFKIVFSKIFKLNLQSTYSIIVLKFNSFGLKMLIFLALAFMALTLLLQVLGWTILMPSLPNTWPLKLLQHAGISGKVDVNVFSIINLQILLVLLELLKIMLKIFLRGQQLKKRYNSSILISPSLTLAYLRCWLLEKQFR